MTTQQFNMHIKLNYKVGDELPLTVLRDGKKRDVRVKLVE
jgi:S1-C subfamily serine protease